MPEHRVDIEEGRRLLEQAARSRDGMIPRIEWLQWVARHLPAMLDELERLRAAECCGGRQCCGGGE